MGEYIKLSKFLKKNAGIIASVKIEAEGKKYYDSVYESLNSIADSFGLENSTQKQGGGIAIGTGAGRKIKEYFWFKFSYENYQNFPITISFFVSEDKFDVSLQLDYKKVKKEYQVYLKKYSRYYCEKLSKSLCYWVEDNPQDIIPTNKYNSISSFTKNKSILIVPHYLIRNTNDDDKIENELCKGLKYILPLYDKIICEEKMLSKNPYLIFGFQDTKQFSKKHSTGVKKQPPKITNDLHYKIQQKLIKELEKEYGQTKSVKAEVKVNKYRADVIVKINENEYEIYEVKPYLLVKDCIREASGQLLEYKYRLECLRNENNKKIRVRKLIIVGPEHENDDSINYLNFLNKLFDNNLFEYKEVPI